MSNSQKQWIKDNPEKASYYNVQFWKDYWKDTQHRFDQGVKKSFLCLEEYKHKKQLEEKDSSESYIYLIKNREYYKIGYTSKTPYDRLDQLQESTPERLLLVNCFKTKHKLKIEKMLHEKFKEQRIIKEWFKLSQKDIDNFKSYCEKFEEILDQ